MTVAEPRTPGTGETGIDQTWWQRRRRYSRAEVVSDALVHSLGMGIALGLGGLLIIAGVALVPSRDTARSQLPSANHGIGTANRINRTTPRSAAS